MKYNRFKIVTGKNGRTIYQGKVEKIGEHNKKPFILISGVEWNKETRTEERRELRAYLDSSPESLVKNIKLQEGDFIVFSYLPARKESYPGIIEEIAKPGCVISTINENNNKKTVIYGKAVSSKWNSKHNMYSISFKDLTDTEGKAYGQPSNWNDRDGIMHTSYWVNVSFFGQNSGASNQYPADQAEKDIQKGDLVIILAQYEESKNNEKTYINHNVNKYTVLEQVPRNTSPHASEQTPKQAVKPEQNSAKPSIPVNTAVVENTSDSGSILVLDEVGEILFAQKYFKGEKNDC